MVSVPEFTRSFNLTQKLEDWIAILGPSSWLTFVFSFSLRCSWFAILYISFRCTSHLIFLIEYALYRVVIHYIPCAVHYITVTYLLYNWDFVPFNPLHLFYWFPHLSSIWWPLVCFWHLWICFCFVIFVCLFFESMYKWK